MLVTPNRSRPGIAVIGSGYWGKNLIRNYHHLGALKLICDKSETVLEGFRKEYPGVDTCLALNDILSRTDIHGVAVATPSETHHTLAREVLLSGKNVYVEKPLAMDFREGKDLIRVAKENGRILMVGHLLQYHPAFVKLKELSKAGELGRINYIYSNRLNLGKIRREENILWSFAPHDISMILALAGEMPEAVAAIGGNYLHKKIADVTTTHLEFPSGLRAHIFVSWLHPFKEQKLIVVGDRKMAVFDDTRPWNEKLRLYPHRIKWENNIPVPDRAEPEIVEIVEDEPLKRECLHFMECISNGCNAVTDGQEGVRVLTVLNAGQLSLDGQGRKIYLSDLDAASFKPTVGKDEIFKHESAYIDEDCEIGQGTKIWHFCHILAGTRIGRSCSIGQNVVIGPDVVIGDNCKIQNNVSVYKGVTLENGVFCGPSMVFTNVYNPRAEIRKMDQLRPTLVKRGATLGANCTIVCGHTIGRYASIGAGAVVNANIPDHALVVGNPAKQIGWVCECGERLDENLACSVCGKNYKQKNDKLIMRPCR